MSFQQSSDSLRARLHMGEAGPPVVIGLLVVAAAVLVCAALMFARAVAPQEVELRKPADQSSLAELAGNAEAGDAVSAGSTDTPTSSLIYVHVSGHVANPGVVSLPEGSRAGDAVEAAGGFSDDAARDAVNLARVVADGEQIIVPSIEDAAAAQTWLGEPASPGATGAASAKVNINTAGVAELVTLDGVGESTANKIIASRESEGPFRTVEDIKRVSGIGEKKFAAIEDRICV